MRRLLRSLLCAVAALGTLSSPLRAAEVLETNHAIITYELEDSTYALTIADFVDQIYGPMFIFLSQISSMSPTPEKVPIHLTFDLELEAVQAYFKALDQPPPDARTDGSGDFAIFIDPEVVSALDGLKTTVAHELFHHLSYRAGIVSETDAQVDRNKWVLEGTAEIAEYVFDTPNAHKRTRFETYLFSSQHHQSVSLLDAKHHAALLVYYLWQQNPDSFRDILTAYAGTRDGTQVANQMDLGNEWAEFTKLMFNRDPVSPIIIDGSPLLMSNGENLTPSFGAEDRIYEVPELGIAKTDIHLPPLSWQHALLNIDGNLDWFNVVFGDLGDDEDFIVHAFLRKKGSETYTYADWSGEKIKLVCNRQEGPCKDEQLGDVQKIVLIMANSSMTETKEGTLVAGSLAKKWKLDEMQVSATLRVPAVDELTLEFGTGGGMLVKSDDWWLKFPPIHFPGDTSALAYKWVNHACRFKGFVKFRRDEDNAETEYEDTQGRMKYTWDTTRVEKGGLINTPSGWWCDFTKEFAAGAAVAGAVSGGAATAATTTIGAAVAAGGAAGGIGGLAGSAAVARIFTDLNTREYPPGSFAGKLSAIMKAMMSLQVPQTGSKKVVMYHILQGPDLFKLQVELQGNVRAFFTAVE